MTSASILKASRWLSKANLRPTRQRLALAEALIGDGHHRHVTAESLFENVQHLGNKVSLATVYNTLRAFCDAGLLHEITVDGTKSYFDTNTHDVFVYPRRSVKTTRQSLQLDITRLTRGRQPHD